MEPKILKSESDHELACKEVYHLIERGVKPGTKDFDQLELLSLLVEDYEKKHFPVPPPHPIEAIRFRLDQLGLDEKDLGKILGFRQRKSDILSGKRRLSLNMIRALYDKLSIPAEVLIRAY